MFPRGCTSSCQPVHTKVKATHLPWSQAQNSSLKAQEFSGLGQALWLREFAYDKPEFPFPVGQRQWSFLHVSLEPYQVQHEFSSRDKGKVWDRCLDLQATKGRGFSKAPESGRSCY